MAKNSDIRSRIDSSFESFGRTLYRNRWKTLVLMALLAAAFFSQLPFVTFDTSNESYFRKDDPTIADYEEFRDQFGREEIVIIAIEPA